MVTTPTRIGWYYRTWKSLGSLFDKVSSKNS